MSLTENKEEGVAGPIDLTAAVNQGMQEEKALEEESISELVEKRARLDYILAKASVTVKNAESEKSFVKDEIKELDQFIIKYLKSNNLGDISVPGFGRCILKQVAYLGVKEEYLPRMYKALVAEGIVDAETLEAKRKVHSTTMKGLAVELVSKSLKKNEEDFTVEDIDAYNEKNKYFSSTMLKQLIVFKKK